MPARKLTPGLRDKLCELIASGQRVMVACQLVGIAYSTHRNWVTRGEAAQARLAGSPTARLRKAEQPYLEYLEAYKNAEGMAEARNLGQILKAAKGGSEVQSQTIEKFDATGKLKERKVIKQLQPPAWQAAAWYLERRMPAEYGRRDVVKLEMEVRQQLEALFIDLRDSISPQAYAELEALVARRFSSGDPPQLPS